MALPGLVRANNLSDVADKELHGIILVRIFPPLLTPRRRPSMLILRQIKV